MHTHTHRLLWARDIIICKAFGRFRREDREALKGETQAHRFHFRPHGVHHLASKSSFWDLKSDI